MQLALTADQQRFQDEVRTFLSANLPASVATKVARGEGVSAIETRDWHRILAARGWAAPAWPAEYGGTGWNLVQRHIFDVECRRVQAPYLSGFGITMVGPAIARYGSEAQKAEHLPRILNAERNWCQGYSEPGAGSDLASVSTRAERDGDDYIINGSKIWTSAAELADWIFCLVRTNPDVQQQKGISFLLLDIKSPGVTIEPLYAFNGKRLWNQVFFDNVRVPMANRLGDEDRGWTVAKSLLGDERLMVSRVAENKRILGIAQEVLQTEQADGEALKQLAYYRRQIDALEVRLQALEMTSLRLLLDADAGGQIGAEPSMLKLKGSELVQAMDELLFEAVGHWVLPLDRASQARSAAVEPTAAFEGVCAGPDYAEYVASGRYHHRGYTIAGGSSEVQRNIIAKAVLGL